MTPQRFVPYAWGVLAFNILVILWGAVVRATGSGAGCGSHWPLCNGEVMPALSQLSTAIELGHRATSGLALILVVILVIWAFRAFAKGHPARMGAVLAAIFIAIEALIGAGLVLFGLVEDNTSTARAIVISIHLVNTFFLLASLALTAHWGKRGTALVFKHQGISLWLLIMGAVGMLTLGVSGAITALGDTLFPVSQMSATAMQSLSPTAQVLVELRVIHPYLAIGVALYWMFGAGIIAALRPEARLRQWSTGLAMLWIGQLGLGLLNLALHAPVWMQVLHLLMADVIWIALVLFAARVLTAPKESPSAVKQSTATAASESRV